MKKEENYDNRKFHKVGIASFISSIVGLFVLGLPCGLIALITGIIGLSTFKVEEQRGRWMAITGLIIGVLDIIVSSIYIIGVGTGAIG